MCGKKIDSYKRSNEVHININKMELNKKLTYSDICGIFTLNNNICCYNNFPEIYCCTNKNIEIEEKVYDHIDFINWDTKDDNDADIELKWSYWLSGDGVNVDDTLQCAKEIKALKRVYKNIKNRHDNVLWVDDSGGQDIILTIKFDILQKMDVD